MSHVCGMQCGGATSSGERISHRAALQDHVTQRQCGSSPSCTTHAHNMKKRIDSSSQRSQSKSQLPATSPDKQQSSQSATCSTFSRQQRSPSPPHLQQNPLGSRTTEQLRRVAAQRWGRGRVGRCGGSNPCSPYILRNSLTHGKKKGHPGQQHICAHDTHRPTAKN